ncbi:MAG: hypothetical protein R2883_00680 [Caldisericia bacterium]
MTVVSTEQTPPTMGQYFASAFAGHLVIFNHPSNQRIPKRKDVQGTSVILLTAANQLFRNLITTAPLEWIIYQLSTLVVFAMNLILIINLLVPHPRPIFLFENVKFQMDSDRAECAVSGVYFLLLPPL